MATISELRNQFDRMSTAEKKQFITNLKPQIERSNKPEHKNFLNECIQKYNTEVQMIQQRAGTAPPRNTGDGFGGDGFGGGAYGGGAYGGGAYGGGSQGGGAYGGGAHGGGAYGGGAYGGGAHGGGAYNRPTGHYAPGSFAEKLHSFFSSTLFLIAIILFSAGYVLNAFLSLGASGIFSLLFIALPIIAYWLMFAASKSPKLPEKILPALTLIKIRIIIVFCAKCLVSLLILIFILIAAVALENLALMLMLLILVGGYVVFSSIYFSAYMKLLGGLKRGLVSNAAGELPGIKIYTIFSYINIGFLVLMTLLSIMALGLVSGMMSNLSYYLPSEFDSIMFLGNSSTLMLSTFLSLAAYAGEVLIVIVMNQFNNSLKYRQY